jgi:Zn-dependent protease with chaperone function
MQRKLYGFLKHAANVIAMPMRRSLAFAALVSAVTNAPLALAQSNDAQAALVAQDVRLAAVSQRLMQANDALCRRHMPLTGLVLHTRDQYRSDPGPAFANGPVAVEAVLPGSPAAALVEAGDAIVAIGATRTATLQRNGEAPLRDTVFEVLADQPAERPVALTLVRQGSERAVSLAVPYGCRALVEIRAGNGHNARSDGRVVQLDQGLAAQASDAQLAVVFAHELAHAVLEHRRRLDAAGVSKGFFGEFGKNQQLNRTVEVEADRLSVHLLANAGYDPAIAPAFWRSPLGRRSSGLSAVYPSAEARAQLLEREIADYLGGGSGPSWPGHLLGKRDRPF